MVTVASDVPRIRLRCNKPPVNVTPILLVAKLTGGVGGWEVTTRPRQTAMTSWQGSPPYQLDLQVMFDEYTPLRIMEGRTIEDRLGRMLAAGRGTGTEPATWRVDGVPMQLDVDEWILNTAEPGDNVLRRRGDFQRVRQEYALTFLEYVPPQYVRLRVAALKGPGPSTMYKVKRNDTPAGIAKRRHINWTMLRTLNPKTVKTANQKLKVGSRIRVPAIKATPKKHAAVKK